MNRCALFTAVLGLAAGCGEIKKADPRSAYRFAPIVRSDVVRTVEATGTVTPRKAKSGIPVGAQVNGKIIKLFVDYNSQVTNGQVVALIDPQVYSANHKSAVAQLHVNQANVLVRQATVKSCEAELALAEKTYQRKKTLVAKGTAPVADLDGAEEALLKARASLDSAKASLKSAEASVRQSEAAADQAKANLDYCTIISPVNGIVVSSMNAVPVLTIAEDLKTIWVEATIPEADVGNIKVGQSVTFTADAYRRKFKGRVKQIRRAATTTNNVVTYPIIIEAENPDEMLFPGMTATLSIETARAENVVVVSAAAFRFRPKKEDMPEGEVKRGRKIWLVGKDGKLEYHMVEEGVSDDAFSELKDGGIFEGKEAVIGYETAQTAKRAGEETVNPFAPKRNRPTTKGTAPEPKK